MKLDSSKMGEALGVVRLALEEFNEVEEPLNDSSPENIPEESFDSLLTTEEFLVFIPIFLQ